MRDTLPLLDNLSFPAIARKGLDTLQVNLTYTCNQRCLHCHVNAGPTRTEAMSDAVLGNLYDVIDAHSAQMLDLTGARRRCIRVSVTLCSTPASRGCR